MPSGSPTSPVPPVRRRVLPLLAGGALLVSAGMTLGRWDAPTTDVPPPADAEDGAWSLDRRGPAVLTLRTEQAPLRTVLVRNDGPSAVVLRWLGTGYAVDRVLAPGERIGVRATRIDLRFEPGQDPAATAHGVMREVPPRPGR